MSVQAQFLNNGLRWIEKPYLARIATPQQIRDGFERRARFWFRMPRDVNRRWTDLVSRAGAVRALCVEAPGADQTAMLIYFHGGGYVFGSPRTHAGLVGRLTQLTGLPACLPNYRLAPEHPYPAAVEDARSAYEAVLELGVAPERIVLSGDSAGGGLSLALLADLIDRGRPLPCGLFAFSPLTDLTFSGASFRTNARREVLLPAARGMELAEMYLQGADPTAWLASPLFAQFEGAPPICLFAGDTEILLDDTTRLIDRLREQGVEATAHIGRDLPHVWPFFWRYLPEGEASLRDVARWITTRLQPSGEN